MNIRSSSDGSFGTWIESDGSMLLDPISIPPLNAIPLDQAGFELFCIFRSFCTRFLISEPEC